MAILQPRVVRQDLHCLSAPVLRQPVTFFQVVVILVVWVIAILLIYMAFLSCLDPMLNRRLTGMNNYREQRNGSIEEPEGDESDEEAPGTSAGRNATPMSTYGSSVINRVGSQQNKWKKQVQEQRRNIYDRRTMLN